MPYSAKLVRKFRIRNSQNIRTGRPIERKAITNLHGIDALGGNSAISHG